MTLDALWSELYDAGIDVRLRDGGLRITNASALADDLRDALREHKPAIVGEMSLPLFERVMRVFGGIETDKNGKPLKKQPTQATMRLA